VSHLQSNPRRAGPERTATQLAHAAKQRRFFNESRWHTVHANQQRTAFVPVHGITNPQLKFHVVDGDPSQTGAIGLSTLSGPHTFPDGVVRLYRYVRESVQLQNFLQLINTQSGAIEHTLTGLNIGIAWTQPTILKDGRVVIAEQSRVSLYAANLRQHFWTYTLADPSASNPAPVTNLPIYGAEELPDGKLLVPTGGGLLHIVDPQDGRLVSAFDLKWLGIKVDPRNPALYLVATPAIARNLLIFVVNEEVLLFNYRPGIGLIFRDRKSYGVGQISTTAPTIDISGRRVFFASFSSNDPDTPDCLHCFNFSRKSLAFRWSYCGPEAQAAGLEDVDQVSCTYNLNTGHVIFNNTRGVSTAFREVDCGGSICAEPAWQTPHAGNYIAAIAGTDNLVYTIDRDNAVLYALDGWTGNTVWSVDVPPATLINLKPLVVDDRVVYYDYPHGVFVLEQR